MSTPLLNIGVDGRIKKGEMKEGKALSVPTGEQSE